MGNPKGFLTIHRQESGYRPIEERIQDYSEVEKLLPEETRRQQASRCMDCGVPFCHWACPVGNIMPEWQDHVYRGNWKEAYHVLQETNNFPEFTGRVCPALCEASCVLSINDEAVTIRQNELSVIEKAFEMGYVIPSVPVHRTGKKIAIIGSGPSGLACADILNQKGHNVTVFEADKAPGGYLRYGIPDFKLEKSVIDRRIEILEAEGIQFKTECMIGKDIRTEELSREFDAICLATGSREPRDINIPGREMNGIHFALEYLTQQNKIVSNEVIHENELIRALDKNVLVIGGGDTGSDCVGTANRQGAASVTQIELLPKPETHRTEDQPWPMWPRLLKHSSSHEEGCERHWNINSKKFIGSKGQVTGVLASRVEWATDSNGRTLMKEIPYSEFVINADLVILAMGFVHPVHKGPVQDLGLETDKRGNIQANESFMTNKKGIFATGDARRGASLIVWAIHEGRKAAEEIDSYLKK